MSQPRLIACADDLGQHAATSAVILDLLAAWRINAASCIVETETWPVIGRRVRDLGDPRLSVGLHLKFSDSPAGALTMMAPRSRKALRTRIRAQLDRFTDAMGRPPHFIDGHHHVHLMGPVREALLEELAAQRFTGWIRQCASRSAAPKALFLSALSRRLAVKAGEAGLATNPGFGGVRNFQAAEDVSAIWGADLARMSGAGGVLMVHPGADDDDIGPARATEAGLIAAGALDRLISQAGLTFADDPAAPWR